MNKLIKALCVVAFAYALPSLATQRTQAPENAEFSEIYTLSEVEATSFSSGTPKYIMQSETRFKAGKVASSESTLNLRSSNPSRTFVADDYLGSRTVMGHIYASRLLQSAATNVTKLSDNKIRFNGFFYADVNIDAEVDWTTGVVTIPSGQKVATVDSMDIYLCPIDVKTNIYSASQPVKAHLHNGGVVFDESFGFFVTEGPSAGAYLNLGLVEYSAVAVPNASMANRRIVFGGDGTMTTENRQIEEITSWAYAYPIGADRMRLMHIPAVPSSGYYSDVILTLSPSGKVTIDPQPVYAMAYYGDFCIYPLTEKVDESGKITNSISVVNPVQATYSSSAKTLTLNPWAVANTSVGLLGAMEGSTITLSEEITFPEAPRNNFEGEGTKESPWLLKSADDLHTLSYLIKEDATCRGNLVTDGDDSFYNVYTGKYFLLANDIDFSQLEVAMQPIGSTLYRFNGTLSGNGKTIKNFEINNYAYDYCALIAVAGKDATIEGFAMESPRITSLGYTVASAVARNHGIVNDIAISSPYLYVSKGYNVGGAVAYNYGSMKNVNVSGAYMYSLGYTGGVVGRVISATVENCHADGRIYAGGSQVFAGGIAGYITKLTLQSPGSVISDCSFSGLVQATNNEVGVGGVAGAASYSTIERCFANSVSVATSAQSCYVGGLVGTIGECKVNDSYATGWVRNPNTINAGGLVGHSSEYSNPVGTTFTNCYSSAMLNTKSEDELRGLAGDTKNIYFTNCFYDAQISGVSKETVGLPTREMTKSSGLEGFNSETWTFTEGLYPRLTKIANSDAAFVSAASLQLAEGDILANIANDFKYSVANDLVWKGVVDNKFSTEGGYAFKFDNGTARLNYEQFTDTIYASKGGVYKYFIANIAPVLFSGSGSEQSPWLISNLDDLKKLASITNNATMPFDGKYFLLTADINCAGDTLQPICKDHAGKLAFAGTFDGAGKCIDNFTIMGVSFTDAGLADPKSSDSYYYSGLFGNIAPAGVVKNLTIGANAKVDGFTYTGLLSGSCAGLITNCRTYGTLRGFYGNAGSMCGYLKEGGRIEDCYSEATVLVNGTVAGGIAGWAASATIKNCENRGDVKACWFNAYQKEGNQTIAGGIVGKSDYSSITDVVNSGYVCAYKQVGGIAATVTATAAKPSTIANAINYGIVEALTDRSNLGAIAGQNTLGTFNGCISDRQLQKVGLVANGAVGGVEAVLTTQLTSGTLNLSTEMWQQDAGQYPGMKRFASLAASKLHRKAVISFESASDGASSLFHQATLSEGVNWNLASGKAFAISGSKLNVTIPATGMANDTLVASLDGCMRLIPLATLNVKAFPGEGTLSAPFQIATADDFLNLASIIDESGYDYEGMYFQVTSNLDFTGKTLLPVGASKLFNGIFDGNGKTFDNVIYTGAANTDTYKALFGNVGYLGEIRNIILGAKSSISTYSYGAGIVASLHGLVSDCRNYATITTTGAMNAAGIVALANPGAKISACSNYGTITSKSTNAGGILGSTVADARITISGCLNEGEVKATTSYSGGIAGQASAFYTDCENKGKITAVTSYAAGITGSALLPSGITRCTNGGEIVCGQYSAGIVATSTAHTAALPLKIEKCSNSASFSTATKGYTGGIGGSMKAGTQFEDCFNTGNITAASSTTCIRIGGITGDIASTVASPSNISNCYNTANISGYTITAGIAGYYNNAQNDGAYVRNCHNTGNISGLGATTSATAGTSVGGLLGNGGSAIVEDCWNSGDITSNGGTTGGLVGQKNSYITSFARNFNTGSVTAAGYSVGGLIGYGRCGMSDCANFGPVKGGGYAGGLLGYSGPVAATMYTLSFDRSFNAAKVEATDGTAANTWNINTGTKYYEVNSLWYDTDIMPATAADKMFVNAKGMTTAELCAHEAGEAFSNIEAAYPILISHADNEAFSFAAAALLFAEGDNMQSVTKSMHIGLTNGAEWTSSSNLRIEGGKVIPLKSNKGDVATLTLKVGKLQRTYNLVMGEGTGLDSLDGEAPVEVRYYGFDGLEIANPSEGEYVIEISKYADGRTSTRRIVIGR